jgi:hypothetical protein
LPEKPCSLSRLSRYLGLSHTQFRILHPNVRIARRSVLLKITTTDDTSIFFYLQKGRGRGRRRRVPIDIWEKSRKGAEGINFVLIDDLFH